MTEIKSLFEDGWVHPTTCHKLVKYIVNTALIVCFASSPKAKSVILPKTTMKDKGKNGPKYQEKLQHILSLFMYSIENENPRLVLQFRTMKYRMDVEI